MKNAFPLPAWASKDTLNVVVETPQGHRNKFKFDEELGMFKISHVLPAGAMFPFDFGFIPSTRGQDGDPLDVIIVMDEPAFPGCIVESRVVGVIEAEQTEGKKTFRNDRLIAVAVESPRHGAIRSIDDLNERLVSDIEHFFESYNKQRGRVFKPISRKGAEGAKKLIAEGQKNFQANDKKGAKKK